MATGALLGGAACGAPEAVEHGAGHLIDSRLSVEGTRWDLLALADGAVALVERGPDGSETGRVVRAVGEGDTVALAVQTSAEVVSARLEADGDPIGEVSGQDPTEVEELAHVLRDTFDDRSSGCPTCAAGVLGVVALVAAAIVGLVVVAKRIRECIGYLSFQECELGCTQMDDRAALAVCPSLGLACWEEWRRREEACVRGCADLVLARSLVEPALERWRCRGDAVARCGAGPDGPACRDRLCPPLLWCAE